MIDTLIDSGHAAEHSPEPAFYRLATEELVLVSLDALTAVYHPRSAQTHLVIAPVPAILAQLPQQGEGPGIDLAGLARRLGVDPDAEVLAVLGARVNELLAIGLVEAVAAGGGAV